MTAKQSMYDKLGPTMVAALEKRSFAAWYCANTVITRLCKPAGRIHVILVGEDLGM